MPTDFVGRSLALSADGMETVASNLGVRADELWTVMTVETSGCGFLPDRRPTLLFERHIFHRLTGGRFDDGDLSDSSPGGYGALGSAQYLRLTRAAQLDRTSALQSASWGLGQILGENCAMAGFPDVESMVAAMSDSEDAQLSAIGEFLKASKLDAALQRHDWTAFAKGYNGPAFSKNRYDEKLAAAFAYLDAGTLP